jgi:serine protein kinase
MTNDSRSGQLNGSHFLSDVCDRMSLKYTSTQRVMSFDAYLDLFLSNPRQQARNAAQYVIDCFEHFGATTLERPLGNIRRWKLFDAPFDDGHEKLVGQEQVQEEIYRILTNFGRQRRVNKLILLHGPNGSAKSSLLGCIARALEGYSQGDDGALYRFNWVFPSKRVSKKSLGFGNESRREFDANSSYAGLDDDDIDATLEGELRDHPLLLLPLTDRRRLFAEVFSETGSEPSCLVPESLTEGALSPRNKLIFERLYTAHHGDLRKILQHVQIERFYVSRRYRTGAVTVEPQMHVDAGVRQLTGDRSLTSLPLTLQNTTLFESHGDLVDANRGIIEYSDLLKRPLDTFKYLLATCEKSNVALPNQILHLDLVFFASSNEVHLEAFKEYPDWPSFKARIELVRVPYIRCFKTERQIYDEQVTEDVAQKRIAPHTTMVASLWAVLSRLHKANPERYPKAIRGTIASLTPLQKADLYATGKTPSGLPLEKARLLRSHVEDLASETKGDVNYEGSCGPSPREMKLVLLNASQNDERTVLTPQAVLEEIQDLIRYKSVYDFLKLEPKGQYHNYRELVDVVRSRWLDTADEELHQAMGLVTLDQYDELFRRYLTHVSHAGRGEKIQNELTGRLEEPDQAFMEEMEKRFKIKKDAATFRSNLLGRIGAAMHEATVATADYREIFPNLFTELENSYYDAQRTTIRKIATDVLRLLSNEEDSIEIGDQRRAQETLDSLIDSFGYCEVSVKETISELLVERYVQ